MNLRPNKWNLAAGILAFIVAFLAGFAASRTRIVTCFQLPCEPIMVDKWISVTVGLLLGLFVSSLAYVAASLIKDLLGTKSEVAKKATLFWRVTENWKFWMVCLVFVSLPYGLAQLSNNQVVLAVPVFMVVLPPWATAVLLAKLFPFANFGLLIAVSIFLYYALLLSGLFIIVRKKKHYRKVILALLAYLTYTFLVGIFWFDRWSW